MDFPETLPLAEERRKRAKSYSAVGQTSSWEVRGTRRDWQRRQRGSQAETHGDVLTEGKEYIQEEEELPNYLMHLAQQKPKMMEELPEEKDSVSKRFFSPRHAYGQKINLGPT